MLSLLLLAGFSTGFPEYDTPVTAEPPVPFPGAISGGHRKCTIEIITTSVFALEEVLGD